MRKVFLKPCFVNLGKNKKARGIKKKLNSFCNAFDESVKSLVQNNDKTMSTKNAIGNINGFEKVGLVLGI